MKAAKQLNFYRTLTVSCVDWESPIAFPRACTLEMWITWLYWSYTRRRRQKGSIHNDFSHYF